MTAPSPRPDQQHSALQRFALPALLLVTALAYLALVPAGFSWDDEALVVDNQVTGDPARWRELFTRDLWSTTRLAGLQSGYYRPLFLVSLAVDRALFGLDATWAHLHSLLWHLLAVGLLHGLLRRLLDARVALVGAAVFALHPVQSEVLALVAARNDSMAAALTFAALWLVLDPGERRPLRLLGAAVLTLAALLSKESAALAPLLLLALDVARQGRAGLRGWPRLLALAGAVGVTVGLRTALHIDAGILPAPGAWAEVTSRLPQIAGVYGSLVLWPWPLTPARHLHYLPGLDRTLLPLLLLLGLLGLGLARGKHRGLVLAGLLWAVATWAPTLAATLDKGLLGERYLYMPLAGLALALAAGLPRAPGWLVPVLAVAGAAVLQLRLPDWKDSRTIWQRAHEVAPTPFTAGGLAWYVHRDGAYAEASDLLEQAVLGDPPYRDACDLVLMSMLQAQQAERAVQVGERVLAEGRCRSEGLLGDHLAVAYAGTGRWDEAVRTALARPGGPQGPSLVVVAAGRAREGDLQGLAAIANRQPDPPAFAEQVVRLLRLGGEQARADEIGQRMQLSSTPPPAP